MIENVYEKRASARVKSTWERKENFEIEVGKC